MPEFTSADRRLLDQMDRATADYLDRQAVQAAADQQRAQGVQEQMQAVQAAQDAQERRAQQARQVEAERAAQAQAQWDADRRALQAMGSRILPTLAAPPNPLAAAMAHELTILREAPVAYVRTAIEGPAPDRMMQPLGQAWHAMHPGRTDSPAPPGQPSVVTGGAAVVGDRILPPHPQREWRQEDEVTVSFEGAALGGNTGTIVLHYYEKLPPDRRALTDIFVAGHNILYPDRPLPYPTHEGRTSVFVGSRQTYEQLKAREPHLPRPPVAPGWEAWWAGLGMLAPQPLQAPLLAELGRRRERREERYLQEVIGKPPQGRLERFEGWRGLVRDVEKQRRTLLHPARKE